MKDGTQMAAPGIEEHIREQRREPVGGRKVVTVNGYDFGEVASAMQKEIRRGGDPLPDDATISHEEAALFWAMELEATFHNYVWKRLGIIACEDVALANPMAPAVIDSAWSIYERIKKHQTKDLIVDPNVLAFAVLYLCRSPKNREVDEFKNVVWHSRSAGLRLEIPEYALDLHTSRGRAAKRGMKEFWTDGCRVSPAVGGSAYAATNRRILAHDTFGLVDDPNAGLAPDGHGGAVNRRTGRRVTAPSWGSTFGRDVENPPPPPVRIDPKFKG